jgi:hypothetical protein
MGPRSAWRREPPPTKYSLAIKKFCCGLPPTEFRRLVRRFDVDSLRTGRPKVLSAEGVTKYSRREEYSRREDERDLW